MCSTRQLADLTWGTQNPAMMREAEFGMVRVRAFGTCSITAGDPAVLLREPVGTDPEFTTDEVDESVRQSVVSRVVTAPTTSGVAVIDLAAHQNAIATRLAGIIGEDLNLVGLRMPPFVVENISLPPEVEATMDKLTSMGVLGDVDRFTKLQAATAITQAAQNPRGISGDEQRVDQRRAYDQDVLFRLLLLPLWIATRLTGGKTLHVVVNANTGEVIGERPDSAAKIAATVVAALAAITAAYLLYRASAG